MTASLLEARGVRMLLPMRHTWHGSSGWAPVVDDVDLRIAAGECLALVGESGSGKTTLARCLLRLVEPSAGTILFRGIDLLRLPPRRLRHLRRDFQMVFQDPRGSLDPRWRVGEIVGEGLRVHQVAAGAERRARVGELLALVGLPPDTATRRPHELSGGQRQRVGVARALATGPALLVADEPVSALDPSIRSQIVNLLAELRQRLGLGMLFIAHDLPLVARIADRVVVFYFGRVVEEAPARSLFSRPLHPYTAGLVAAIPSGPIGRGGRARRIRGEIPSFAHPPSGCRFHPRCPIARARCAREEPRLRESGAGRLVACHFPGEVEAGPATTGTFGFEKRTQP